MTETKNNETDLPKGGELLNVAYFGNTHGSFVRYFIDKFSELTPPVTQSPFDKQGSSDSVDFIGHKIGKFTFEDVYGLPYNNYEFWYPETPHVLITIKEHDLPYFLRLMFLRPPTRTNFPQGSAIHKTNNIIEKSRYWVDCSKKFVLTYKDSIKENYNFDISQIPHGCPKIIIRDFIKMMFFNLNENTLLSSSKETLKNVTDTTICINVSEILNRQLFFKKIEEINNKLNLKIVINDDAIKIHNEFLNKNHVGKNIFRTDEIIQCIKNEKSFDLKEIDIVEQAFINAWIEQNYQFVIAPNTTEFFDNTLDIIDYLKYYPQHYKAMNPNLPTFNGRPNPFYLWKK